MFEHIVVPLDGSEFSRAAIPYALALAQSGDTTVELVSSVELLATLTGPGFGADLGAGAPGYAAGTQIPASADLLESSLEDREAYLRERVAEIEGRTAAEVRWAVLDGDSSEAVAVHVEETGADLVVLSTHGRGGLERAWLGSVADRLVRRLDSPLLLIRPSEEPPGGGAASGIERVLVSLDGSELAESVLDPALRLGRQLGAGLVLLRVLEPDLRVGSPYLPHEAKDQEEHVRAARQEATDYLERVAERLRSRGGEVGGLEVRSGRPADVIPAVAEEMAQLVAMATHGRGGLRRFVLGSVSDKVLRRSDHPLFLVRPEEDGAHD